jgi:hypothetical protein
MWRLGLAVIAVAGIALAATTAVEWTARGSLTQSARADREAEPSESKIGHRDTRVVSQAVRAELLARAHVWQQPAVPVARAVFSDRNVEEVNCWFKISDLGGTTPKFDCVLDTGEDIRIKYGNGPEIPAETAATRLLEVLGFGADRMTLVKTLRCYGCPEEPFSMMKAVEVTRTEPLFKRVVDYGDVEEFTWVALERRFDGRAIETDRLEGWAIFELDSVNPRQSGAPRRHVDALRLMAMFLAHWDNKSENQRLVCLDRQWPDNAPCARPFLLLQDVGATFGPSKMDVEAWAETPLWEDRANCVISMREMPYDGATFGRVSISESGRQFLGHLLSQLSDKQLHDLFSEARFGDRRGLLDTPHSVAEWIAAFRTRVRAVTDGPRCPLP